MNAECTTVWWVLASVYNYAYCILLGSKGQSVLYWLYSTVFWTCSYRSCFIQHSYHCCSTKVASTMLHETNYLYSAVLTLLQLLLQQQSCITITRLEHGPYIGCTSLENPMGLSNHWGMNIINLMLVLEHGPYIGCTSQENPMSLSNHWGMTIIIFMLALTVWQAQLSCFLFKFRMFLVYFNISFDPLTQVTINYL